MRHQWGWIIGMLAMTTAAAGSKAADTAPPNAPIAIALHGGAGTLERSRLAPEEEAAIRAALAAALDAGHTVLNSGGSALDAVSTTVAVLEDSPHFNAGKGAVFNAEGRVELDASIMDGASQRAGAVAGVSRIANPIRLARAVMEQSPHVMLIGAGAEQFAQEKGFGFVPPEYFHTPYRWQQYLEAKSRASAHAAEGTAPDTYFGTVGAVALDAQGHLAAATSTGGMVMKRYGRVGDSPIIGAGTWADAQCAVSGTGWGEYFIRMALAHEICARVRLSGQGLAQAADAVVMKELPALGGNGGVIAVDAKGNVSMPFNTSGMYRASIDAHGNRSIAIFRD